MKRKTSFVEQESNVTDEAKKAPEWSEGEILRMVGHDLRTPLNGISGFLELLEDTELTAEQRDYLSTARQCAEILRSTLGRILESAQLDFGKLAVIKEPVDVSELLNGIAQTFDFHIRGSEVILDIFIADDLAAPILLDRTKTRQIIENLVGNAINSPKPAASRSGRGQLSPTSCALQIWWNSRLRIQGLEFETKK